jgi:methionyl-tRNA formyltransferase
LAQEHYIPVFQPEDINTPESISAIQALRPDLLVTIAYGLKLKKAVRESAVYGAINLHPSLLPELRGAAPIPFALWEGKITSGITIFKLTANMDAGPVFVKKPYFVFPSENATDLSFRFARIGAKMLLQFLQDYFTNPWEPEPQEEALATYCRKIEKEDCLIDWHKPALEIQHQIRALSLLPGAHTYFRNLQFKLLEADVLATQSDSPPGSIVALEKNVGLVVQTLQGQLMVKSVQPAGKKPMSAWAYHLGSRLEPGERFSSNG